VNNLPLEIRDTSPAHDASFCLPANGIALDALERDLLSQALTRSGNNKTHAARLLGISRDALNYRLKKFELV
jgi:DNA-binding NtrC family response regulator